MWGKYDFPGAESDPSEPPASALARQLHEGGKLKAAFPQMAPCTVLRCRFSDIKCIACGENTQLRLPRLLQMLKVQRRRSLPLQAYQGVL